MIVLIAVLLTAAMIGIGLLSRRPQDDDARREKARRAREAARQRARQEALEQLVADAERFDRAEATYRRVRAEKARAIEEARRKSELQTLRQRRRHHLRPPTSTSARSQA